MRTVLSTARPFALRSGLPLPPGEGWGEGSTCAAHPRLGHVVLTRQARKLWAVPLPVHRAFAGGLWSAMPTRLP